MALNGYNLLEPEHSKNFPLIQVEILFPSIFNSKSIVLQQDDIDAIYYNEETEYINNMKSSLKEKDADRYEEIS